MVAASLLRFTRIAVDSTYLDLLPGFMLLGIGIAMTMSPMTSAAMNAVPVEKAGVASGVLSMFRMVGGSLGVAVTGAIFQGAVGTANFADGEPAGLRRRAQQAMAVSAAVAARRRRRRRRRDPRQAQGELGSRPPRPRSNPGGEIIARGPPTRPLTPAAYPEIERRPAGRVGEVERRQAPRPRPRRAGDRLAVGALDLARGAPATG